MHKEGHIGIGLALYSPIAYLLVEHDLMLVFGLGLVGIGFWSFAPDFDMSLPIPHRGPTHSFVAAILAGVLTAVVAVWLASRGLGGNGEVVIESSLLAYLAAAGFGLGIGVLGVVGHLLGDVLTPMGIKPWWPYSERKHSLGVVLAANEQANQGFSFFGALALTAAVVVATIY